MSRVIIHPTGNPSPSVTLEQTGDDSLEGGVGGWEVLDRPTREAMTAWRGTPGLTWTLPVSLVNLDSGISVERDIALLESWARPTDALGRPPQLVVAADVGRAPSTARWVINGIEWGEQIRNGANQRIRQDLTLTLLKYVPGKILKGPAAKSRGKRGGKGKKGGKGGKG
jgi:hypothetical protein